MNDLDKLREIVKRDKRYQLEAYIFVLEALEYTLKKIGTRRHVSGKELLEGIKEVAKDRFGGLAKMVFERLGIYTTEDFGEIVFNLVDEGLMTKTEKDSKEDFKNVYNFSEVFDINNT
jgi:uncharacterized repeat protein (TIGR04138 family)